MKNRISTAALALGIVSGGATAGPLADLLGTLTGGSGLTGGVATGLNTLTDGFNGSPLNALTTLPTFDANGDSLVGLGAFESSGTGNGQLVGIGAGNGSDDTGASNSGQAGLVGLGALNGSNTGNSDVIGVGAISGDNSGNGGLVGLSALSSGGNSGQGGLVGAEVLNGDSALSLNSGMAGQSQDIIPNPTGMSATALNDAATSEVRNGLQSALQRGGDVSGPLEQVVVQLDDALVSQLGDGLAPVTDQLAGLAGLGLDSDGQAPGGPGGIASAVLTGDNSGQGNDISAGIISGGNGQGNGDVVGAGAFSGDSAGGNGVASVGAISGGNSGKDGDANVGVANSGEGSTRNGGGLLSAGIANTEKAATGNPCPTGDCGRPEPPTDIPTLLVTNGKAEENCTAGSEHNETGLKGAGQLTQFNTRSAKEDGCKDIRLQELSANL